MPLYDWACPHHHAFETNVPIAVRDEPIPCEGLVNQLAAEGEEGAVQEIVPPSDESGAEPYTVWVRKVPCILKAKRVEISHSHPSALLDYGLARNRDLAREGRYTGVPSTRGVRKSQI